MELKKYGFAQAGEWIQSRGVGSGIAFKLTSEYENARVAYAFVVGDTVKYIGICEKRTTKLKDRLKRYKYRQGRERKTKGGENTNRRNARQIKKHLRDGEPVLIFALQESVCEFDFFGLKVDIVKGLENPLIDKFKPEWNR